VLKYGAALDASRYLLEKLPKPNPPKGAFMMNCELLKKDCVKSVLLIDIKYSHNFELGRKHSFVLT
jgi:hypothetical protein